MSNTADTDGGKPVAGPTSQVQDFIFVRELSEVYLLLDHISGRWDKPLPGANPDPLKSEDDWIEDICRIGWPSDETDVRRAKQASTLVKAKNKLNAAARPATGATIAFTLMVVGEEYLPKRTLDRRAPVDGASPVADASNAQPAPWSRGFAHPPTRISLARNAFPGLINGAVAFQRRIRRLVVCLCVFLFITCALSWYVSAGNIILTHLDAVHLQEHEIERKINLLVANAVGDTKKTSDATTADRIAWRVAYLCSAPTPKAMPAGGAAPNVSNMADLAIRPYSLDLMSICKALIAKDGEHKAIGENLDRWMSLVRMFRIVDEHTSESKLTAELAHESHADDEEFSRVLTQVLANAVLPFCYGILGAGAAVVRDLWAKMKESLLAPRDYTLAVGQLALGAIIGACIGLFISPAVAGAQSDNILGGFVLTGSALSFVAGFGVEGVFLALESLVRRVFNMSDVGKKT